MSADPPTNRSTGHPTSSFDRFVLAAIAVCRRLARAWRALSSERRLAAYAAFGLFVTLFLPWYQQTVIATTGKTSVQAKSVEVSGWGAFSLVQAIVLLVAVGTLALLFERAEGGRFQLPGGDGGAIFGAGVAACVLIVWAMFDRPDANGPRQITTATGIDWGIFIALAVAALLAYAGSRLRAEHEPEAPTDPTAEAPAPAKPSPTPPGAPPKRRARSPRPVAAARPAAQADDDATRVSRRTAAARDAYDSPTPISNRRLPLDEPTKVSGRHAAPDPTAPDSLAAHPPAADSPAADSPATAPDTPSELPTRKIGPRVTPEEPPTLKLFDDPPGPGSPEH